MQINYQSKNILFTDPDLKHTFPPKTHQVTAMKCLLFIPDTKNIKYFYCDRTSFMGKPVLCTASSDLQVQRGTSFISSHLFFHIHRVLWKFTFTSVRISQLLQTDYWIRFAFKADSALPM